MMSTSLFSPDKSMAEIDNGYAEDKKFRDALGEDGIKKLRELEADSIDSVDSELFSDEPRAELPARGWVKADPDFWKPKPAMAPAAKPAAASPKRHRCKALLRINPTCFA